jgi:hypothetical protein
MPVEGRDRGYSGVLAGDRALQGNTFALKVEDESAKINVNGGILDAQDRDLDGILDHQDTMVSGMSGNYGWNAQLTRVLDALGAQPGVNVPNLGQGAIQGRPPGGYGSVAALQATLGVQKDLSPYITVSSWVDTAVIRPNGLPAPGLDSLGDAILARGALGLEEGGRPPVNLNAAPSPVLVALLEGLEGEACQLNPGGSLPFTYTIVGPETAAIADAILGFRVGYYPVGLSPGLQPGPFRTWSGFSAFCDALVPGILNGMNAAAPMDKNGGGNLAGADLLKAMFNPNSRLMKFLPDQIAWQWIDKSDLVTWSTEGSLGPTGAFILHATGRILDNNGRLLAMATLRADARLFRMFRQTTQQDFLGGRPLDQCLSLSTGVEQTTGAAASWNTWGAGKGLAMVTYPAPPCALPAEAADFDGALGLATVELPGVSRPGLRFHFLQHFDDSWVADLAKGSPARQVLGNDDLELQPLVTGSPWPASGQPSTFSPDGCFLQYQRAPSYEAQGNLPEMGRHGGISFWEKCLIASSNTTPAHDYVCTRGVWPDTMCLIIGHAVNRWGLLAESEPGSLDFSSSLGYERQDWLGAGLTVPYLTPDARWHLVTAMFDTDEPLVGDDLRLLVQGAQGLLPHDALSDVYDDPFASATCQDLVAPGLLMTLGGQYPTVGGLPGKLVPSMVMDEFAILDLTDNGANVANLLLPVWHDDRFVAGRYYKGNDAAFTSTLLDPEPGSSVRLLKADWTASLPSENRKEMPIPGQKPMNWKLPPSGANRFIDPILQKSSVEVELLDASGAVILQPLVQGARLDCLLTQFRYRVRIKPNVDPLSDPVLETPFFDDITLAYVPSSGAKVTGWAGE